MKDSNRNRNRKALAAQQRADKDQGQRVSKYAAKVAARRAMFAKTSSKDKGQ